MRENAISRDLTVEDLPVDNAFIINPKEFHDDRGVFLKLYNRQVLKSRNVEPLFVEEYLSISKRGSIRGLHYQLAPYAQAKLVRCIRGAVFDVILDLRRRSPTFGKWCSVLLSEQNKSSVFAPRGFAHGFLSLEDGSVVSYNADNDYEPEYERGIIWNDKSLAVKWPKMDSYIVSRKDMSWPTFEQADKFD